MDARRLTAVLLVFVVGVGALALWANRQKAGRQSQDSQVQSTRPAEPAADGKPPTTAASSAPRATASNPASRPTGQAASTAPASMPAEAPPQAIGIGIYARNADHLSATIGSLGPSGHYVFQLALDSRGAAIRGLKLADYFATVADKRRYEAEPATYNQALGEEPGKYRGFYALLKPVGGDSSSPLLPMATGRLKIEIEGQSLPVEPVDLDEMNWRLLPRDVSTTAPAAQSASFSLTLHAGMSPTQARPLLRVVKTYQLQPEDYSIQMSLAFENLSDEAVSVTVDQLGPTGVPKDDFGMDMRRAAYAVLQSADKRVQARLKNITDASKNMKPGQELVIGTSDQTDPILWVGFVNKFFGSMMYLKSVTAGRLESPEYRAAFFVRAVEDVDGDRTYATGVRIPKIGLAPGKSRQIDFDLFAGPKKRDIFTNQKDRLYRPLYAQLHYIGTIDFGQCFCTFSWLALGMMWLLDFFSATVTFGNYGLAVILLVLLVRLVLHPLTKRSQVSMMRMQKLAPEMQKLKEKYADDKNALNREMMKVYKDQGPSQLMGCLPMFLQMPLWIALYTGLNAAVELRHAAFLPFWITDLSAPDALFSFGRSLPWIGPTFNLLPILLAVAMYFQQKYTPTGPQAAASEQAQQTQKMMKYMPPVMMLVFFYKAPAGLTLYIMASTFAGVLDQYFVRKHIRDREAAEAAEQTTVTVPGKAARSSRPKKPRGPFWVKKG